MKLLFYRYGSICEPFILSALSELGTEVVELSAEVTDKQMKPSDVVQTVSRTLLDGNFDLVFSVNFFPVVSDVCNIFHIPYAGWTVDSPVMELYSKSVANKCNYLFLFDRCQYQEIAPLNPGHVFYLPLGSDPVFMQSVIQKGQKQAETYRADLSFVGSLYTEKCAYDKLKNPPEYLSGFLNGLMAAQQKIYGYYFIDDALPQQITDLFKEHMPGYYTPLDAPFLTDTAIVSQLYIGNKISALERVHLVRRLAACFPFTIYTGSDTSNIPGIRNRGLAKTLTEMPLIFHSSTINLNITSKPIRSGIPLRVWDILSCGGFVLTNYQAEIPEYFCPGEHIEVYENVDDLLDKCNYYLDHPSKAAEIAQNGLALVSGQHTYRHRMETLLLTVFEKKASERACI